MENKNLYDAIIIGGGPAGLTAAIYLARAQYRVLVLEKEAFGGQIKITAEVVNYPGILQTDGENLTRAMRQQAENFGAEFMVAEALELKADDDIKVVKTNRGDLRALGLIIATGANPRKIGFIGEEEFQGRGVAYCATCDGEFFTGKEVLVIGGGFAAVEEAVFLTKYASHVTILVRKDKFSAAKSAADKALNHPDITVKFNHELKEVSGDGQIDKAVIINNKTGEEYDFTSQDHDSFGVFVFAGYIPASGLVKDLVDLDDRGYIITDSSQQTSIEGIYAAGDICIKPLRQVVTAVSDGAIAATELEKYAAKLHEKLNVIPQRPEEVIERTKRQTKQVKTEAQAENPTSEQGFLDDNIRQQLASIATRFSQDLVLKVYTDQRPVSRELTEAMREIADVSDRFHYEQISPDQALDQVAATDRPCVKICDQEGQPTGLAFHGVPGGHEFQSFVIGLYNAAGPGQTIADDAMDRIKQLPATDMQIIVSLTCTQCPDLVMAAQKIASVNPQVTAEAYDISHFEELGEKYKVMSVPCLILNHGEKVSFGKKSIDQLLDMIESLA